MWHMYSEKFIFPFQIILLDLITRLKKKKEREKEEEEKEEDKRQNLGWLDSKSHESQAI